MASSFDGLACRKAGERSVHKQGCGALGTAKRGWAFEKGSHRPGSVGRGAASNQLVDGKFALRHGRGASKATVHTELLP